MNGQNGDRIEWHRLRKFGRARRSKGGGGMAVVGIKVFVGQELHGKVQLPPLIISLAHTFDNRTWVILEWLPASVYVNRTTNAPPQRNAIDPADTRPKRMARAPTQCSAFLMTEDDDRVIAKAIQGRRLRLKQKDEDKRLVSHM